MIPPLDPEVVREVRELWPRLEWTQAMRDEWRRRLGTYDTDRILEALRDAYSSGGGFPSLARILEKLKAQTVPAKQPWQQKENQQLIDQIEQEAREGKEMLRNLPTEEKKRLVEAYRERIGRTPPSDLDTWSNTQILLAGAILALPAKDVIGSENGKT